MRRSSLAYLADIVEACDAIAEVLAGVDLVTYGERRAIRSAVEREFIIVGEAAAALSRLEPAMFSRITHGRRIVDFRNQLTHEYPHVDDRIVWFIARDDVPVLRAECAAMLTEVGDPD
jgi:uncharacterized protein with HEPN domain